MVKLERNTKGFTLVEIMIVVAIIGLLVAIAIPNLLRARLSANESAAKGTLRTYVTSLENFRADQSPPSYPVNLTTLQTATPPYIDPTLAGDGTTTLKQGYQFWYFPATAVSITIGGTTTTIYPAFSLDASPMSAGQTGNATFYGNSTGVIYSDPTGAVAVAGSYSATPPAGMTAIGS